MSFYIAKGSILDQKVDAIVVPSQPSLKLEGSVGGIVKDACGDELELELEQFKKINISECVIANSYHENFKRVILVANPRWIDGKHDEDYDLAQSYLSCLFKAQDFNLSSIAFPLLSVGAYEFPKRKGIEIAIRTILDFLSDEDSDMDVILVIYSESLFKTYKDIFDEYKNNTLPGKLSKESETYLKIVQKERHRFSWYDEDVEDTIDAGTKGKTFAEKIKYYMTIKGLTKLDCYCGVISKNMFNNYLADKVKPGKYTVVSLGINMGLDIYEINDLLSPFGYKLEENNLVDKVIYDGLLRGYTIEEINSCLSGGGFHPVLKVSKE